MQAETYPYLPGIGRAGDGLRTLSGPKGFLYGWGGFGEAAAPRPDGGRKLQNLELAGPPNRTANTTKTHTHTHTNNLRKTYEKLTKNLRKPQNRVKQFTKLTENIPKHL